MISSAKSGTNELDRKKGSPEKDTSKSGEPSSTIKAPHHTIPRQQVRMPRIAVLVDTSSEWGRNLVKGVNSYAIKHGPWKLWVDPHGPCWGGSNDLCLPLNWNGDGIIAPMDNELIAKRLAAHSCPVVNVSPNIANSFGLPHVSSNVEAIAAMALEHFNHRGLKNFGYAGPLRTPGVAQHAERFQSKVAHSGFNTHLFDCVTDPSSIGWNEGRVKLAEWLVQLPKPIGILTWQSNAAIQILDICGNHGISVPDDVSVLAGDDDELLCGTTTPTLSGVVTASEHIGFAAAQYIDSQLKSQSTDQKSDKPFRQLVDPIMVNLRQSTDCLAITDPDLLAAVRFIRMNACHGITVQQVADSVPIGRRSLERKFKECFGRTPLDEIQRLRLARVRELLVKTDLPISKIAKEAGFGTPEYMTTMFKCRFGLTPLKFRSQSRAR